MSYNDENNNNNNNTSDNLYNSPNQNPEYSNRINSKEFKKYKNQVYEKISKLLINKISQLEPYIEGKHFSALQKTYRGGTLVKGKSSTEMAVVQENDFSNISQKEHDALFSWLDYGDVSQLDIKIIPTAEVGAEVVTPPDIILQIPNKQDLNINDVVGTMDLNEISIKDNVSQFIQLEKGKTNLNRKKLSNIKDLQFSEMTPITFTHLLEEYQQKKNQIPLYKWRTDDFFQEYHNSRQVPFQYRLEKFFEEFHILKNQIPKGYLAEYETLADNLENVTDKDLFGWETLTYLVRESQDLIGSVNPIYNQDDARSWLQKIGSLQNASGSLVIDRDYWRDLYNSLGDEKYLYPAEDVFGCTDPEADNFNQDATTDDGSCLYEDFVDTTSIHIKAIGTALNNTGPRKLFINDSQIYNISSGRGLRMTVFSQESLVNHLKNGTALNPKFDGTYDTYGNEWSQTVMAENILTGDWLFNDVFIITSYDAVIYSDLLVGALKTIGGCNPEVINGLGSNPNEPVKDRRTPYVLLGTKGLGECGGYESVGDDGPYSPHSQVSILFPLDENEEGIVSSPGRGDSEEDREISPVFDESFTDWQDKYSPNNYWFRSTEGGGAKSYKIGHVLKTDGPAGASDGGVRIYRKTSAGEWPGALYMPTTDNEHVNPTWIGEQKRTPQHVFLQEGRTYSVEVWGRCETSDGKAYVNVADKRQPDGYDGSYVWSKTSKWDTINPDTGQAVWTKNEFEFTPIKNWHVQDKWKVDFYYDPNDNFGSSPPFDTSGETLPLVKTLYLDSVDYDWNGGYVEVASNDVRIEVNGTFYAQQSGNYKFRIYHDDGARMWFDGDKIIDFWSNTADRNSDSDTIYLSAGTFHTVRAQMYEDHGHASFKLKYQKPNDSVWRSLPHATNSNANAQDVSLPPMFEGVMMNFYLYPGTTNGADAGQYCDYANLKITPKPIIVDEAEVEVPGCTNSFGINYNPVANVDDGSCVYDTSTQQGCELSGGDWNMYETPGEYYEIDVPGWLANSPFFGAQLNMCDGIRYLSEGDCYQNENAVDTNTGCDFWAHEALVNNLGQTYCVGPYYNQLEFGYTYYQCDNFRQGGLIGNRQVKKLRRGGSILNSPNMKYKGRTRPVVSDSNIGRTAIASSKEIDTYGTNNLTRTYDKMVIPESNVRGVSKKQVSNYANYNKLNPNKSSTYGNNRQQHCEAERRFLVSLSSMGLSQMKTELDTYLSMNEPCLSVKPNFHLGGQVGHNSMDHTNEQSCCHTICGDSSGDSNVNVLDVVNLVGIVLGSSTASDEQFQCSDLNQDGQINILDVVNLVQLVLDGGSGNCNLCEESPVGCDGIIDCNGDCFTEYNGVTINGPEDISLLPLSSRFGVDGVCGSGVTQCSQFCSQFNQGQCNETNPCRHKDHVIENSEGEWEHVPGPFETTPCSWNGFDGVCEYGDYEIGGRIKRVRRR